MGSVSGGGFVAGMCVAAKVRHCQVYLPSKCILVLLCHAYLCIQSINPKIKVIASEPKNADDCARSFAAGKRLGNETPPDTICDALK